METIMKVSTESQDSVLMLSSTVPEIDDRFLR
jgi:hypothetical protein